MQLHDSVNTLKAAADPTRLRLLALLAAGEATVGELVEALEQSQPRVSRHLRILCQGGLADKFRDGHSVYYRLPDDSAARAFVSVLIAQMSAKEPTLIYRSFDIRNSSIFRLFFSELIWRTAF